MCILTNKCYKCKITFWTKIYTNVENGKFPKIAYMKQIEFFIVLLIS